MKMKIKRSNLVRGLPFLIVFFGILYLDNIYQSHVNKQCLENYLKPPANRSKQKYFIPYTVEEAPIGSVPTVPVEFIIEEKDFCLQRPLLRVIIYVHSAIHIMEKREATRKTWASSSEQIGVVFMVGRAKNDKENEIVQRESEMHHDIVQGNYTDLYELLIYKALNSLHWITKNCDKVPWVVHADDDVMIDTFKLLQMLLEYDKDQKHNLVFCNWYSNAWAYRNPSKKWHVSYREYPCLNYPFYCLGSAWLSSMKAIKAMYKVVPLTKYLWVDDVYLTGVLRLKAGIQIADMSTKFRIVEETTIGKVIMWAHVESNRTADWSNILKYYQNKIKEK